MMKISSSGSLTSKTSRNITHTRIEDEKVIYDKYELGNKLGQGSYGVVYEIICKETNEKFAIKMINKERANKSSNFENEVQIMKSVTHPNLIKLEEVFESKKKLYLITELCEAGELSKWLKKNGPIKEEKSKIIMKKIVDAISYLHKNDIVHRDLKLENILIKENVSDVEKLEIKITDFGLSTQRVTTNTDSMFEEYCGTPLYMAPEIIDNFPYSSLCDIWALGIIMYFILTSHNPFTAETEAKLHEQIRKAEINTISPAYMKLSAEAKDCLQKMMKVNPAHRITSSELISHPWFLDKKLSDMPESHKNVLELMQEMLKEQDSNKMSSNSSSAIATHENEVKHSIPLAQKNSNVNRASFDSKMNLNGMKSSNRSSKLSNTSQSGIASTNHSINLNHSNNAQLTQSSHNLSSYTTSKLAKHENGQQIKSSSSKSNVQFSSSSFINNDSHVNMTKNESSAFNSLYSHSENFMNLPAPKVQSVKTRSGRTNGLPSLFSNRNNKSEQLSNNMNYYMSLNANIKLKNERFLSLLTMNNSNKRIGFGSTFNQNESDTNRWPNLPPISDSKAKDARK